MVQHKGVIFDLMFFLFLFGGLTLLLMGARRLGASHHARTLRKHPERASAETDGTGYLVSSALALLGLLIGFTFSMAVQRYDERRHAVVAEANAISTVYSRAGLFDQPVAAELQAAVARYAKDRRDFAQAGENASALAAVGTDTADAQNAIWAIMKRALNQDGSNAYTTSTLSSMNEMFDLAATRQALVEAHLPLLVLVVLVGFALATAYLLGYGAAHEQQGHRAATSIVFALVAIAITLIVDLDRPRVGFITVDQEPLERVIQQLNPPAAVRRQQ